MTHFSFDFIPSVLESYKLHIKCLVRFGRQWLTFISGHFFWIQQHWLSEKGMKIPHWIFCILQQHCIWPVFFIREYFWFGLTCFEKEMLSIFFQENDIVGFYIYDAFLIKSLFQKQQQHVSNFLILLHLLVLAVVENPELLKLCTDIGTNCPAVKWNTLLFPFLLF